MCTSPRAASFYPDGRICLSPKSFSKELVPFKVPCGKCAECLLERARDWATRCTHESKMHASNSFLTLTYADEHIPRDHKLNHTHFQHFMEKIRKRYGTGIGFFMCGEYGEKTGRPHYHACLFGLDFQDKIYVRDNIHGDQIWNSEELTKLWGLGHTELGSVTHRSAGYVARYVLKKQNPNAPQGYQKMSRLHAIGKKYVEKWYKDIFINARGSIVLDDGTQTKVPRYYEKWLNKNHPDLWIRYVTEIKPENTKRLSQKAEHEHKIYIEERDARGYDAWSYRSPLARKREILNHKQNQLKRSYL